MESLAAVLVGKVLLADFIEDFNAAPDGCLFFAGHAVTSYYGTPEAASQMVVKDLMSRYGIDELNIVDRNGIVLRGDLANGDGSAGLLVHHNAFYGTERKGNPVKPYGSDTLVLPRQFADEAAKNYALPASSPALKGGVALQCVPADINGNPYPKSGPRPCGAYAK